VRGAPGNRRPYRDTNQPAIYGLAFRENLELVKVGGTITRFDDQPLACFNLLVTIIKHLAGGVGYDLVGRAREVHRAPIGFGLRESVVQTGHYRIAKLAVHGKVILARVGQQFARSCHLLVGSLTDSGRSPSLDNVFHKSRRLDIHWRSRSIGWLGQFGTARRRRHFDDKQAMTIVRGPR
jgi:hypothetical protein